MQSDIGKMTLADGYGHDAPPLALVAGASGYVGTHLVPRLVASGFRVRAAARSLAVLAARNWSGVELYWRRAMAA